MQAGREKISGGYFAKGIWRRMRLAPAAFGFAGIICARSAQDRAAEGLVMQGGGGGVGFPYLRNEDEA